MQTTQFLHEFQQGFQNTKIWMELQIDSRKPYASQAHLTYVHNQHNQYVYGQTYTNIISLQQVFARHNQPWFSVQERRKFNVDEVVITWGPRQKE